MILRNTVARHGRTALTAPMQRLCRRCLSTEIEMLESSIKNHTMETGSIEANLNRLQSTQTFVPPTEPTAQSSAARDYQAFKHVQKRTGHLGSIIGPHYEPYKLVNNPRSPKDVTLELLMASQAHMGHSTSLWNPRNQRYIYGIRQGIHIISLEVTAAYLRRAAKVVEGVAYHGGLILFVGTRPGQDRSVIKAAQLSKGCHLFERWIPGSITNSSQILSNGGMKVVDQNDEEIDSELFRRKLSDYRAVKPDLVVCLNPLENYICLRECGLNNIPTIGIIDTDADPTWVTYPIPANDDSLRATQLIAGVLGRAGESGQKKRLEAAKSGVVTWSTHRDLEEWRELEYELNHTSSADGKEESRSESMSRSRS
ncbi:MAG: 37S ribosomal protein, mitochondrial [Claussenomyces sp. TS43310]|nr:MAG: 37S ribosomal protein, mitochondrial [Claussenomyces sp. TS43310]